jgi:hypothetical protein
MPAQRRGVRPPVIDRQLAAELDQQQYRGRYVAIANGHVIASGDTVTEVIERAHARSVSDPLVHRVPARPRRPAFYGAC